MSKTPLIKKLRIQPGQRVLFLNAPEGFLELLGDLPEGVDMKLAPDGEPFDFVHVFAKEQGLTVSVRELVRRERVEAVAAEHNSDHVRRQMFSTGDLEAVYRTS